MTPSTSSYPCVLLAAVIGCGSPASAHVDAPGCTGACDGGSIGIPNSGVVTSAEGPLHGQLAGTTWSFKGIPYAAPPVGPLRWKPPRPVTSWTDEREATSFGPMCPQKDASSANVGDEDCLTLDVWAPASAPSAPRPVLVFIHGGAFITGASSVPLYDGQALSEFGDVVVVSINYRLGLLGYMAHPALAAESESHASGNYGTLDQIEALRWVQRDIGAFGGDPSHVLLFGQSAGAISVCSVLASPLSRGLYSSAMMLSGNCGAAGRSAAETSGLNDATIMGCGSAANVTDCLRTKAVDDVLAVPVNAGPGTGIAGPSVDGWVLDDLPLNAIAVSGQVPLIISTTHDEFTDQLGHYGGTRAVTSESDYEALMHQLYPTIADQLIAEYPASDYASPNDAVIRLFGDRFFICPSRTVARQRARSNGSLWRAEFEHTFASGPRMALGAAHAFDLFFGMRNLGLYGYAPTSDETTLADSMAAMWVSFAATGDPTSSLGSHANPFTSWQRYDALVDDYVAIDQPLAQGSGIRTPYCDFWDDLTR